MPAISVERPGQLPGRGDELACLLGLLEPDGPHVAAVHGIGGVGKTTLADRFADLARARGATVVQLDGRRLAPTPISMLNVLAREFGVAGDQHEAALERELADHVRSANDTVVLVLDHIEVLPLLDSWLRQRLVPALTPWVRFVLVGREALHPVWRSVQLAGIDIVSLEVGHLSQEVATDILRTAGVDADAAETLAATTGGHPLSIWIALDAIANDPNAPLEPTVRRRLTSDLAAYHLDGLDPATKEAVEALAVVRRGTSSTFSAMLPERAPGDVIGRLSRLPFVERQYDGLAVHDAVRTAITAALEADNPLRHADLRRRAWGQIQHDLQHDPTPDTWRYTADLLFLIENPLLRDGFFPEGSGEHRVEAALPDHLERVAELIRSESGEERALCEAWLASAPEHWKVAIDRANRVTGCALLVPSHEVPGSLRRDDPVVAAFDAHRRSAPVPPGHLVLYLRAWMSEGVGELPSGAQAALWLDCKRTYLDHRHTMRRLYTSVGHLDLFLPVLEPLGFRHIGQAEGDVAADLLLVDFGPGGVNGWLSGIASRELGIEQRPLLDPDRRVLNLDDAEIALTPLEFGVIDQLVAANGKPVGRAALIERVWGHSYTGGSNVVDAVVRTLRRKMGHRAIEIEAVRGIGYRHAPT